MSECIIGKAFNVPCNQQYLNAPAGTSQWHSISNSDQEEILLKAKICGINLEHTSSSKVCTHHKSELTFPSSKGKRATAKCADPFNKHKKFVNGEVLKATTYYKDFCGNKYNILPGQHLCINCFRSGKRAVENEILENEHDEWQNNEVKKFSKVNQVCRILGLSEIVGYKLNSERIAKKAERKLQEIVEAIITELRKDQVEVCVSYSEQPFQKAKDHDSIFAIMKQKFIQENYKHKIQLLTMIPNNSKVWTIEHTSKYFNCSRYAVIKSREIRDSSGFLSLPPPCKPKTVVHPDVMQAVEAFYKREDNVWQSPNVRDTKKIKLETGVEEKRKAFLLHSLKDLYAMFRNECNISNLKLGFSTFARLRPKECELYGTMSLQNVCVCVIHGNVELMLSGIGEGRDFQQRLTETLVCDKTKFECMTDICDECSKTNKDLKHTDFCTMLEEKLCEERFEAGVRFALWKSDSTTKRVTLVETSLPAKEYIESLYTKFLDFLSHEYTTKVQSKAFQEQKKDHSETTALVIGDFSENYTCVFQNEVQSAYFSKTQVTIHPFVAYVKYKGKDYITSSAVISDHLKHNTVAFYSFQTSFLGYLRSKFPHLEHIEYWSDGCAAQYKNYKNFMNIWCHKKDFGLTASWNFFATSHGKTGSDGVGATVKYRTKIESLRRVSKDYIDSAEKVYQFCQAQNWEIHPIYVSSKEIENLAINMDLRVRFGLIKTLPQTQKCHRIEINNNFIRLYRTSISQSPFFEIQPKEALLINSPSMDIEGRSSESQELETNDFPFIVLVDDLDLTIGAYVVVICNGLLYIARIASVPNSEVGTISVQCLKTSGCEQTFSVAEIPQDITTVKTENIISLIHPVAAGTTKRASGQLKVKPEEVQAVIEEHKNRIIRRRLIK